MYDIGELVEYYQECEFLDFKREEYNDNNKPHLIKDVLAFSNAKVKGNKYIVIGVSKKGEEIDLYNIESKFDSANIQQYIQANITPELDIEYNSYLYKGHNLLVLVIKNPLEQPYMTLKDVNYPNGKICLKSNECWIRKGSHQLTATRSDFDRIYKEKAEQVGFVGNVAITFPETGSDIVKIDGMKNLKFPSVETAKKLEGIIAYKEDLRAKSPLAYQLSISKNTLPFRGTSYEERSIERLKENLEQVSDTYRDEDLYYLFEQKSFKLNLNILNNGSNYIEDASIEITIPKMDKLLIADKVHFVVRSNSNPLVPYTPRVASYEELNYPLVKEVENYYVVTQDIGNLKHNIKQMTFKSEIRLAIGNIDAGTEINLHCKIFGKNLKTPIEKDLKIITN